MAKENFEYVYNWYIGHRFKSIARKNLYGSSAVLKGYDITGYYKSVFPFFI